MTNADVRDQQICDKWEVQLRRGCLELAILAVLWDARLYGLEILRRLESDSDLIVSEGTIYPLLSRLKALGLVESQWVESDAGHPRKYYALTAAGKHRTMQMAGTWTRFSSSMSKLLGPLPGRK
jgi:PadR family transcriptional regulator PadR